MEKLRLIQDEPDLTSELFQFERFSTQLESFIVDPNTSTPFNVGIHDEWGGGKTSLIRRTYEQIRRKKLEQEQNEKSPYNNLEVVWFDAWEYERTDPVLALMTRIASCYAGRDKQRFKRIATGLLLVFSDMALRAHTNLTLDDVKNRFESMVKEIPTITSRLEDMVAGGRLIVFIDDLDRCIIENALGILEAVKLFLNAKGVIFVIAVDMTKLERAWELRYHGSSTGVQEGREHVDKIFQLKLSLPPKEIPDLIVYVENLSNSLPEQIRELIVDGCKPNPRKIKRVLNLIYFICSDLEEEKFKEYLPAVVIWCIATTVYPELSRILSRDPSPIVILSFMAYHLEIHEALVRSSQEISDLASGKTGTMSLSVDRWKSDNNPVIKSEDIHPSVMECLEYIHGNRQAFYFLKAIAKYYSVFVPKEVEESKIIEYGERILKEKFEELDPLFWGVIHRAGLVA